MYFGLQNNFLYTAYRIYVTFEDDLNKKLDVSGTCFFILNSQNEIVIVTNRHVVDKTFKDIEGKYSRFKVKNISIKGKCNDANGFPTLDQEIVLSAEIIYSSDIENDVAVLKRIQILDGANRHINYLIDHKTIATDVHFKSNLDASDFVAFPGFPDWYDKKENRPILRFGTIASDPRYNYSDNKSVFGDCVAYEAFSFGGSSGSPVFALQRGVIEGDIRIPNSRAMLLVGINAGHLKTRDGAHSGISYFYKASILIDLID